MERCVAKSEVLTGISSKTQSKVRAAIGSTFTLQ